jgi:hypothetical protein
LIKIEVPSDQLGSLLTLDCVNWLRSRPEGVPEVRMKDSRIWIEFVDPATAEQFEQIWLGKADLMEELKATRAVLDVVTSRHYRVGSGDA